MTHDERMRRFRTAGIYLVTSQSLSRGRGTPAIIQAALNGGVRLIQLREKEIALHPFLEMAREARALTAAAGALLIINDRPDVALAVGADGVHLGQEDFPVSEARRLAPHLVVGASTHSIEEARQAAEDGASYVNIGPVFPTSTKQWTRNFLGLEGLRRISRTVSIPFTVMGGIKREHIPELVGAGARVIAVVTAITMADDPEQAARELVGDLRTALATRASPGISPEKPFSAASR
jgi:thiamine-phosphate pyrophosphorylase